MRKCIQTNKRKRKWMMLSGLSLRECTEWYFLLYTSDGISCTIRNPLSIQLVESVLKKGSKEEKRLHEELKHVMEAIVGLLRDKVEEAGDEKATSSKLFRVY